MNCQVGDLRDPYRAFKLASDLADAGAAVDTVAADASDPEGLRAALTSLYAGTGAPEVLVYNASMLTPDSLLSSDIARLYQAYDVDVVGAIVATQVAAPAMRAAGGGTILFTGGGWADHPRPALATVSLGKAALRPAATMLGAGLAGDGIRVASFCDTLANFALAGRLRGLLERPMGGNNLR